MVVQTLSKFGVQILPAVCASLLSAAVLAAFQLTPAPSPQNQHANPDLDDETVYIDVLPRINRDPAPPAAPVKPVVATAPVTPAPTAPVAVPQQTAALPPAAARNPVPRPTPTTVAKVDPAPKAMTAPNNEPMQLGPAPIVLNPVVVAPAPQVSAPPPAERAPRPETTAMLSPPMPIGETPPAAAKPATEQSRVLGMRVPRPVTDAGGAVIDVAKLPIQFADTLVARPVWRVGEKIVTGVAGWVGGR